jgi:predicted esterase
VRHGWIAAEDRAHDDRRNDDYLRSTLDELCRRFPVDPARTVVLGYSQGAGVATHFLLTHPDRACGLVGLAGGLAEAYRGDLSRLSGKEVLWVTGRHDDAYPPAYNEALLEAWRDAGASLHAVDLDAGHDLLSEAVEPVRRWLLDGSSGVLRGHVERP